MFRWRISIVSKLNLMATALLVATLEACIDRLCLQGAASDQLPVTGLFSSTSFRFVLGPLECWGHPSQTPPSIIDRVAHFYFNTYDNYSLTNTRRVAFISFSIALLGGAKIGVL